MFARTPTRRGLPATEGAYFCDAMDTEPAADVLPPVNSREGRAFYLAQCDAGRLCSMVDDILGDDDVLADITVVKPAVTGSIVLQVREPVCEERFFLGDAVVSTAEVALGGSIGWIARMGTDVRAAMAGAIADALLQADRPGLASYQEALLDLISDTRAALTVERTTESRRLAATVVEFEELD